MSGIDWMDTPLTEFYPRDEIGEGAKTTGQIVFPHGDGKAHEVLRSLQSHVERTYEQHIALGDYDWLEKTGEVPVIRDTQRGYELAVKGNFLNRGSQRTRDSRCPLALKCYVKVPSSSW